MITWKDLLGKKIIAFRGYKPNKGDVKLEYVLFDDNKTILNFTEQDKYDYHDCSMSARNMNLQENTSFWNCLFDKDGYDEPKDLSAYPF